MFVIVSTKMSYKIRKYVYNLHTKFNIYSFNYSLVIVLFMFIWLRCQWCYCIRVERQTRFHSVTTSSFITDYSSTEFLYYIIKFQDTKMLNVTLASVPFKSRHDRHVGSTASGKQNTAKNGHSLMNMSIGSDVIEWREDWPPTHGHHKQIWLNANKLVNTNWHNNKHVT
jgi:hypothetical protein